MKRAWFDAPADVFAKSAPELILGHLTKATQFPAELAQITAWQFTIDHLQAIARALPDAHIFLEFAIPRMGRRADAIIVSGPLIFVIEYKVGEAGFPRHAIEQTHGYALDLKNFHVTSHDKAIIPILVATRAPPQEIGLGFWAADRVHDPLCLSPDDVLLTIRRFLATGSGASIDAAAWAEGAYRPTPSIIEAAEALYAGHDVAAISRSEAGAENLSRTAHAIAAVVSRMREQGGKAICFVTGVPGAGKTLAGLNLACQRHPEHPDEHAVFLSGNGPLVAVLREALRRDGKRTRDLPDQPEARILQSREPDTFIQNIHHFRDFHLPPTSVPNEHVVVFDEAQRAWDKVKAAKFMTKRGHVDFDQSEPSFLLSVMDRRPDWCVVICLIGEGQEINEGEAGVAEWISALQADLRHWHVFLPPHLLADNSPLNRVQRWHLSQRGVAVEAGLHLAVSVRSFRAERVSAFVAALLAEDASTAAALRPDPSQFPIAFTRDLSAARRWLRQRRRAGERAGLLASSNALRLKPEGLHVKAPVDVCHWFLDDNDDVRSSNALEDAAVEFDVQGLELDWSGVAWDLNYRRTTEGWQARRFHGSQWQQISATNSGIGRAEYVRNAYRVLLTRARQGMVIFVPRGDADDATRPPAEYDAIADWLRACGVPALS